MDMPLPRRLPTKLSDLIELAIEDVESIPHDLYWPVWTIYHSPPAPAHEGEEETELRTCFCTAGAVIIGTLQVGRDEIYGPGSAEERFGVGVAAALFALDSVREGNYADAVTEMGYEYPGEEAFSGIPEPEHIEFNGWEDFDAHMGSLREIAVLLRKEGY